MFSIHSNSWVRPCINFKDPIRISKIKPFINEYDWKEIKVSSETKDWEKFEWHKSVALNVLFVGNEKEEIKHAYISKYDLNHENKVIFVIIIDGEK